MISSSTAPVYLSIMIKNKQNYKKHQKSIVGTREEKGLENNDF